MLPRKRRSNSNCFVPPFAGKSSKLLKPAAAENDGASSTTPEEPATAAIPRSPSPIDKVVSVLAEAGCTLINPSGPPYLPCDLYKLRRRLDGVFSNDSSLRSQFIEGFSCYIKSTSNFRRVLLPCQRNNFGSVTNESLVRVLLLVSSIQQDLQDMLIEKLPEYFEADPAVQIHGLSSSCFDEDVARLILNQFRWLDFLVDSEAFTEKLLQVLSIAPHDLKKEIIGSLPEIIGEQNNRTVINSLQQMLEEDSSIIVPILDSFSNLSLVDLLQDQVIMIGLSCLRTINIEHIPYLLRFLLLSATPTNARLIISKIREQLKIFGGHIRTSQHCKNKGKLPIDTTETSVLDALRSSLRFKNMLCQDILKELKSFEEPHEHKVIDIWLLTLIHMNSRSLQKSVEKLFWRKIVEGCIQHNMFDQCIHGVKELSKEYLPTFLSISAYLLACKEQRAWEYGIHMYASMFDGFLDAYSRQEVVGALLTHVGSGIRHEVSAALDTLVKLASEKSQELISLSSHMTGLLDYLEGFSIENVHKVYEVFILLALSSHSNAQSSRCSVANELLTILRKQINNSDLMYKKMGLIGTLKIVSYLADVNNISLWPSLQKSKYKEAVDLLKLSSDSCKQSPLPMILFYEELISILRTKTLHPTAVEWIVKQVGEFESVYLSDLDGGNLLVQDSFHGLKGELWMNLDGDISPICLNILPLVFPSSRSTSPLQVLPANFLLLSVVERLINQGSLGGIDALLGCPFHLPSSKLFAENSWQSLSSKQKQIVILSLYYAANLMRELLNAFSTQAVKEYSTISQETKEGIILKLLNRLRNLVFVEILLDYCLKQHHVHLPEVYPPLESLPATEKMKNFERMSQHLKGSEGISQNKKKNKINSSSQSTSSNVDEKLRQPTVIDMWRRAGSIPSPEILNEDISSSSKCRQSESAGNQRNNLNSLQYIEVSAPAPFIEAQKHKFRPLSFDCFSMLSFLENTKGSCCADPAAEQLPLHLYLLRDLHKKLDFLNPTSKQISSRYANYPAGFAEMKVTDFLSKMQPLFPYLRRSFDRAINILVEGAETCQDHWTSKSNLVGNPEITGTNFSASPTLASSLVFEETLNCMSKMLNLPDVLKNTSVLSDLLQAFHPLEISGCFFQDTHVVPSSGSMDYIYTGSFIFLGGVFEVAITFSFILASEVLLYLDCLITSMRMFLHQSSYEKRNDPLTGFNKEILPFLCKKLGNYAQKLLTYKCDIECIDDSSKVKGEMVQKILRMYLENSQSTSDLLTELTCSVLPQVPLNKNAKGDDQIFPTLCPATSIIWYRVMHEVNLSVVNNLVKEISLLEKSKAGNKTDIVPSLLNRILQSVNVVVSLISICRTNDKVAIRSMTVKYCGKFIDSFLKVFYFLQAHFENHKELILQLIKDLQKATRIIQTLCSEAKGSKQTAITSRIPATKRSMEQFIFHVKSLLCKAPSDCTFWMGNLKHKDLKGHIVSSQAYLDDHNDDIIDDPSEVVVEDHPGECS